jgi:hypothetical protein
MRVDIHALMQDAHDLDGFVGERTVEDDVLPHPMLAIPGSDGTEIPTAQGIGGQFVEAKVQLRQIAVSLLTAPARGGVTSDAQQIRLGPGCQNETRHQSALS